VQNNNEQEVVEHPSDIANELKDVFNGEFV